MLKKLSILSLVSLFSIANGSFVIKHRTLTKGVTENPVYQEAAVEGDICAFNILFEQDEQGNPKKELRCAVSEHPEHGTIVEVMPVLDGQSKNVECFKVEYDKPFTLAPDQDTTPEEIIVSKMVNPAPVKVDPATTPAVATEPAVTSEVTPS